MIFNMTGGGGNPLNFKVVGGTTKPSNPKENTIWVNTDKEITGWHFVSKQPEDMKEGEVWFSTGTSSTVEFNALKKNGIQVYPISAKQYVSGACVDKTAQSYQGGKWGELVTYVLNLFDYFTTVRHNGTGGIAIDNGTVTATTTGTGPDNQANVMYFSYKTIDLSEYKTLSFHVKNSGRKYTTIGFYSANTDRYLWNNKVAVHEITDYSSNDYEQDVTVDVSNVNSLCYFAIGMSGFLNIAGKNTAVVSDIKLLK